LHPSNKQLFLLPPLSTSSQFCHHTFASFERAASSAATPLPTSSQFCHHTFASLEQAAISATTPFQRGANSAATLLHPSNQQPFLLPHYFNKEPVSQSHFCIPRTSSYFCYDTTPNKEPFLLPHLYQAAGFAVTLLHPSNQQPFLLPHHFNKEPFLPSHFCILRTSSYIWYHTAILATTPPSTSSRFYSHTFASFNKEPILLPHFCIPRTSSYFCYQPLQTSSQFCCPHLFQQAASFATNLLTFARAFLQLRQAFRVTNSGTLRRLEEEVLLSGASFSLRARRGSDPALSGVDCGLLADVLSSLNEGRILREDINNQWAVSFKVCLV
jgi:hypothetical protein